MTVAELIAVLKKHPKDLLVAYRCHSEQVLMEPTDPYVCELGVARPDGWVHADRPDKPKVKYLVFPGN